MARAIRANVKDGWYHVTARGIERMTIFKDTRDHKHFLELLEEMSKRYGVEVHAYCLSLLDPLSLVEIRPLFRNYFNVTV